jgi:adenylate cyclase
MLTPNQSRNLIRIVPFGIIWGLFGFIYVLLEYGLLGDSTVYPSTNNIYDVGSSFLYYTSGALIMGILLGAIEVFWLNKLFIQRSFWKRILIKTVLYFSSIVVLSLSIIYFTSSARLDLPLFHPAVVQVMLHYVSNFAFVSILIYAGVVTNLSLFILEVSDYVGGSIFNNFFIGKYHHPHEEDRIFMFLDIKSSTTIAEHLGNLKYFGLLKKYFSDITPAIIHTSGEIYQYAGDEVIVSWDLEKGLQNNNCVRCFFMIKDIIGSLSENYIEKFGLVPEFKAGFHYGKVTTGEIGILRKEIFYTGDVLNTTARIQASCNGLGTDNLISRELITRMNIDGSYELTTIGECELRGRRNKIILYSFRRSTLRMDVAKPPKE